MKNEDRIFNSSWYKSKHFFFFFFSKYKKQYKEVPTEVGILQTYSQSGSNTILKLPIQFSVNSVSVGWIEIFISYNVGTYLLYSSLQMIRLGNSISKKNCSNYCTKCPNYLINKRPKMYIFKATFTKINTFQLTTPTCDGFTLDTDVLSGSESNVRYIIKIKCLLCKMWYSYTQNSLFFITIPINSNTFDFFVTHL